MNTRNFCSFRANGMKSIEMDMIKGGGFWAVAVQIILIIVDSPEDFKKGVKDGCSTCK